MWLLRGLWRKRRIKEITLGDGGGSLRVRRRPDGSEGHTGCLLQLGTLVFVLDSLLLALMRMKNLASEYLDFLSSLSLYPLCCLEQYVALNASFDASYCCLWMLPLLLLKCLLLTSMMLLTLFLLLFWFLYASWNLPMMDSEVFVCLTLPSFGCLNLVASWV